MVIDQAEVSAQSKMDPEIKNIWTTALRSGNYEQTKSMLHNPISGGYCCLGVLAKVAGLKIDDAGYGIIKDGSGCAYDPIKDILGDENGNIISKLWTMNDSEYDHYTFDQIADYIDANL